MGGGGGAKGGGLPQAERFLEGRHFGFQIPHEVRIAIWSFQDNLPGGMPSDPHRLTTSGTSAHYVTAASEQVWLFKS